ncbi:MAG: hypothetical protein V4754_02890 [Pseudomonadota bacterium]
MPLKPISAVPKRAVLLLAGTLALQLLWQRALPSAPPRAAPLPAAPAAPALRLASLGEPLAMSRLLMLYLQAYDDQPGVRLRFNQLDYAAVLGWLDAALALDPRSQYPLLAASQVYGASADPARVRLMLDWVYRRFGDDPQRRWPWLAQAALVARHRLHDLPLARRYAHAIRQQASGPGVPAWARELEAFIAQDMNELDSARSVIGALIAEGRISDPHELRFLSDRLDAIAKAQAAPPARGRP